jgi:hypothetical protein
MGRFSDDLAKMKKVDNHAAMAPAKIEIRNNVLQEIGESASVFDAFGGSGKMYEGAWRNAKDYVGSDLRFFPQDDRLAYVADNRRVMRSIDLGRFNVFDFDAYGSPWENVLILASRRTVESGEKIGIVITDGSGINMKQGGLPNALKQLCGIAGRPGGINRQQDQIMDTAIMAMCKRMNCELLKRWQANGKTGASMRYIGLVLAGK